MKVLYSQIKELVPGLTSSPKEVGEALTLTGFMMDSFTEVSYKGKNDYLIGLEIRQNRADCLSVIGLAREVAAYFNLKTSIPKIKQIASSKEQLDIKIEATRVVKRVLAIKIDEVTNQKSPDWLKEYMAFYDLNSVNLLVDLSNYVMLLTGYPSHLIDYEKISGKLTWATNKSFDEITTLFGSVVKLQKETELIIKDEKDILALAGIVGGEKAKIDIQTKSIIAEIAVYDRSVIRKNSRSLNLVTEASHRLEKDIDQNGVALAMNLLVSLILKYAGGKINSSLFDYYPKKYISPSIKFETSLPSRFAGIEIKEKDVLKIFKNLNFIVKGKGDSLLVTPPTYRLDIALPEDLVEEVIRIYGYDRIPVDEVPKLTVTTDITPKNIILAEKMRDIMTVLGFDETLSWTLTKDGDNELVNYLDWDVIIAQNSSNDIYPNLRQSMIVGLLNQLNQYIKNNVDFINIFEIGKVFGEKNNKYLEHEAIGILSTSNRNAIVAFKDKTESLLRLIGLDNIEYIESGLKPKIANANSCWDIYCGEQKIGILYKLIPQEIKFNVYCAEINVTKTTALLLNVKDNPVVELTQKLVILDANVELENKESIVEYLKNVKDKFNKKNIWSISIVDVYVLNKKIRHTVRVTYVGLSDQEAKKIHLKAFGLK